MTRTVAIIQARLRSSRLPGKVLYELGGKPMIVLMVERVRRNSSLSDVILATGSGPENDALAEVAAGLDIPVFRGPEDDVLARYAVAADENDADVVVRLTGDCPLADPDVIGAVLDHREAHGLDYCTNVHPPSWPDGLDCSVFTRETLERANREASLPSEREHVVPWMWAQSGLEGGTALSAANVSCPEDLSQLRLTIDTARDYLMMRALVDEMGAEGLIAVPWLDIVRRLEMRRDIVAMNANEVRDTGLMDSRKADPEANGFKRGARG